MAVNNIGADNHINPMNRQQMQIQKSSSKDGGKVQDKQSGGDTVEISELAKYRAKSEDIPEPNEGRIGELKEAVRDGSLLSPDVINTTAAIIADNLLA